MASKTTVALWMALLLVAIATRTDAAGCQVGGKTYSVGETWNTRGDDAFQPCSTFTCRGDSAFTALTCPASAVSPGCRKVPGPRNAVYPNCCPKVEC